AFDERNFDLTRLPTSFDDFYTGHAFRGGGQQLHLEAVPGTSEQRYVAHWREPFLFDSRVGLSVDGYFRERIYDQYTEHRGGRRVGRDYGRSQRGSVAAAVRVEGVGVHHVVPWDPPDYLDVAGNHLLIGAAVSATYSTTDSAVRPTRGHKLSLSVEAVTG